MGGACSDLTQDGKMKPSGLTEPPFVFYQGVFHDAFAVQGNHRIEVDQLCNAVRDSVRNARDHHPAVTVANQDNRLQFFKQEGIDDVADVYVESDILIGQVDAFALTGQRGSVYPVSLCGQQIIHPPEGPATAPSAVNDDNSAFGGARTLRRAVLFVTADHR